MLMENRSMVTEIRNEEESYNRIGERVLYWDYSSHTHVVHIYTHGTYSIMNRCESEQYKISKACKDICSVKISCCKSDQQNNITLQVSFVLVISPVQIFNENSVLNRSFV
jgi:hypothetical protein